MTASALQIRGGRHNRVMSNQDEPQDQDQPTAEGQAPEGQDADSYYGEEDMAGEDLDLSFLDEEADEDEGQEKRTA